MEDMDTTNYIDGGFYCIGGKCRKEEGDEEI